MVRVSELRAEKKDSLNTTESPDGIIEGENVMQGCGALLSDRIPWELVAKPAPCMESSRFSLSRIRELPDHFQSDERHEKQPEAHRSALLKAKCQLLKVLTRSRGHKRPDLTGEITEKSLALKSEKTFS